MPNNPIWGHLKWVFGLSRQIMRFGGKYPKRYRSFWINKKVFVTSNSWIVTKHVEQFKFRTFQDAPQLTIFDTMSSKSDSKYTNALYLALNLGASDNPTCAFGSPDHKFKTTSPIHIGTK